MIFAVPRIRGVVGKVIFANSAYAEGICGSNSGLDACAHRGVLGRVPAEHGRQFGYAHAVLDGDCWVREWAHKAFDVADYIQISQTTPGRAKLLVTLRNPGTLARTDLPALFDVTNVDIDWSYELLTTPIRTPAGKLKLRV